MQIALSGYYGCGNTGDEAVLAGIVESFARHEGARGVEFIVLSANPADTERRHGLRAIDRMRLSALRRTFQKSSLLISGGGSLLQDATSFRSLVYYLWVVRLARMFGAPAMFYAQGIGPLRRRVSRLLTRMVANRVQYITVRDPASAALLKRIGVNRPPVEVTADPAFALSPEEPDRAAANLRSAGVPVGIPVIGIALRPWQPPEPTVAEYARMAGHIAEKTGAHLLFLPMQPPGDMELAGRVAGAMPGGASVLREPLAPRAMLGVIGALSGLVAMRLHALIFGALGGVPLAALNYDPKVAQLMTVLGQSGRLVDLTPFDAERPAEQIAEALAAGEILRQTLRARAAEQAEKALVNTERALAVARISRA
jgi:polysaccharide pyruvyl transferase CsaB